jgi:hypothetical protein
MLNLSKRTQSTQLIARDDFPAPIAHLSVRPGVVLRPGQGVGRERRSHGAANPCSVMACGCAREQRAAVQTATVLGR